MIIVAITGPTLREALNQIRASSRFADMFECRLDLISGFDLRQLLRSTRRPALVTCRPQWEGGAFAGSEDERMAILSEAADLGAQYIDLEAKIGPRRVREFKKRHRGVRVIVSQHHFGPDTPDPRRAFNALRKLNAFAVKLAFESTDARDIAVVARFLGYAWRSKVRAIAVAMGEAGESSRILYRRFGGWATFAAAELGASSAPGQIPASIMKTLYSAGRLTPKTKIFGLVGNPVRYSRGILLFNPLFQKAKINAVYCRFAVEDLQGFMADVSSEIAGLSVTKPHKQEIMKYLAEMDESSAGIGAVNTLLRKQQRFCGANTDAAGALDAIEEKMPVRGRSMLVLGAGGTARAIAWEAIRRGATILITNRTHERAVALAESLGASAVLLENIHKAEIVANATSSGMTPQEENTPLPAGSVQMKLAFDAVYNPVETRFLREARMAGAETVSGLEMYIHQAARQFFLFTGKRISIAKVRRIIER